MSTTEAITTANGSSTSADVGAGSVAAETANPPQAARVGPGPTPRGGVPAVGPALLFALVLLGAAVVLVRDALVDFGALSGDLWSTAALQWFDGRSAAGWMIPAGIAVALVGLWVIVLALRPRPRTAFPVGDTGQIWISPRDLARLARASAARVDGVHEVRGVSATRRRTKVSVVTTTADPRTLRDEVRDEITTTFAALGEAPGISVKARTMGERS